MILDTEMREKLKRIPESRKRDVLAFVDSLIGQQRLPENQQQPNPFLSLAGFVEMEPMTSDQIDDVVYGL